MKKNRGWDLTLSLYILVTIFVVAGCSSIDCPLNNRVYAKYKLAGNIKTLADSLTLSANLGDGNDSVIINKSVNTDSFQLPMSYQRNEDVFFMEIKNATSAQFDTIKVTKTNTPHFEAVDCNPAIFHVVTGVTYTKNRIDTIVINNPNVTYDATKSTFLIHFKNSSSN